jgi:pimeloyl-ACP methyl ester carboxylesterase
MANPYLHAGMGEHEQLGPVSDAAVAAIAAPTLVMVGDQDTGLSRLCADYLADTIPGAQLQVFAGADHFVSTAQPAAFNKALQFIPRQSTGRSPARDDARSGPRT